MAQRKEPFFDNCEYDREVIESQIRHRPVNGLIHIRIELAVRKRRLPGRWKPGANMVLMLKLVEWYVCRKKGVSLNVFRIFLLPDADLSIEASKPRDSVK
jgi:hypothetical protein